MRSSSKIAFLFIAVVIYWVTGGGAVFERCSERPRGGRLNAEVTVHGRMQGAGTVFPTNLRAKWIPHIEALFLPRGK